MSPSDNDSDLGAVDAIPGLFALVAIIGSSQAEYVKDLVGSIRQIFGKGGLEAALLEEKGRAKVYALALAAIADGAISDAERDAVRERSAKYGIDGDEALSQVSVLIEEVRDAAKLRERVARCATDLTADERIELFVEVKNLAHRGSRAWPSEAGAAYRGAAPSPEALVAVFREALGIQSTEP